MMIEAGQSIKGYELLENIGKGDLAPFSARIRLR